jgi:integrase/recombinase XerD
VSKRKPLTGDDLRAFVPAWLKANRQRSEATAANYEYAIGLFVETVGKRALSENSASLFLDRIEGLAPGSRAAYVSAVRSFLRFVQDEELPEIARALKVLIRPRVGVASKNRYLTEDEIRAVLEAARRRSEKAWAIILMLALTGLRVSELARLQWRNIWRDPQGNILITVHGKGGKERDIALLPEMWDAIRAVRREENKRRRAKGEPRLSLKLSTTDATPVFPTRYGDFYSRETLWQLMKRIVADAEIPEGKKKASPHWLRHSFGVLTAIGGVSTFALRETLGHSRLETTTIYTRWAMGFAESAVHHLPKLT